MQNKCYSCFYRGTVPGSAHSSCQHPMTPFNALRTIQGHLLQLKAYLDDEDKDAAREVMEEISELNKQGIVSVTANQHGIDSGWFFWPFDFDPVWLESCTGYEEVKRD